MVSIAPPGALTIRGVPLAATPAFLLDRPMDGTTQPAPSVPSVPGAAVRGSSAGVFPPGASASTFAPDLVAGAAIGQVSPYAVLEPLGTGTAPRISVVLPPDVAALLQTYPMLQQAASLVDALLARIEDWTAGGAHLSGQIARAVTLYLGSLMIQYRSAGTLTPDLAVYLWTLRASYRDVWVLFTSRAGEATGTREPQISSAASAVLAAVLALPLGTLPPSMADLGTLAAGVTVP